MPDTSTDGLDTLNFSIRSPHTKDEWQQYYQLRWKLLRQPWNQPVGSEKDEFEAEAIHRAAFYSKRIIAVGRIQFTAAEHAQIRYMAVDPEFRLKGIGSLILKSLEQTARDQHTDSILLEARETAVKFYLSHHYQLIEASHLLFGEIQHYTMQKTI